MAALSGAVVAPRRCALGAGAPAPRRARATVQPVRAVAAPDASAKASPTIVKGQVLHSATKEQLDVVAGLDAFAEEQVGAGARRGGAVEAGGLLLAWERPGVAGGGAQLTAACQQLHAFASACSAAPAASSSACCLPPMVAWSCWQAEAVPKTGAALACVCPSRAAQVVPILKPVDKCWQPQDFLPDPESPDFLDAVSAARRLPARGGRDAGGTQAAAARARPAGQLPAFCLCAAHAA